MVSVTMQKTKSDWVYTVGLNLVVVLFL